MLLAYGAVLFYKKSGGTDILNKKYIIWLISIVTVTIICLGLFPYLISITQDIKLKSLLNSSDFMSGLTSDYIYSLIFTIAGTWVVINTEKRKCLLTKKKTCKK